MDIIMFEETIMRYLLFLVHIQQSIKIPSKDKINIFDFARNISKSIFSNVQSYITNKNEYNGLVQ